MEERGLLDTNCTSGLEGLLADAVLGDWTGLVSADRSMISLVGREEADGPAVASGCGVGLCEGADSSSEVRSITWLFVVAAEAGRRKSKPSRG